jgi:hypothetical protein
MSSGQARSSERYVTAVIYSGSHETVMKPERETICEWKTVDIAQMQSSCVSRSPLNNAKLLLPLVLFLASQATNRLAGFSLYVRNKIPTLLT